MLSEVQGYHFRYYSIKIKKNDVGTRYGIGSHVFPQIAGGFRPPLWGAKSIKSNQNDVPQEV